MYVLIITTWIVFNYQYSPVVEMQQFSSEARCRAAEQVVKRHLSSLRGGDHTTECVPQ